MVVVALFSLAMLGLTLIGWAFGGRVDPIEDFWTIVGLLLLGIAPSTVMLVLALQRRPGRSVAGAVVAGIALLIVLACFAAPLADTGSAFGTRLYRQSLPLLPEETEFTVEEATEAGSAVRAATLEFLDLDVEYQFEYTQDCELSTGIPGSNAHVSAYLELSDWPEETVGTAPELLRAHWQSLGYDATLSEYDDGRVFVEFVSDGHPELTGRAFWEPGSLRFTLLIDGHCMRD